MRIHSLVVVAWAAVVALDCAQAFDASVRASPASLRLKGGGALVARATSAELHNAAYELSGKVQFPTDLYQSAFVVRSFARGF